MVIIRKRISNFKFCSLTFIKGCLYYIFRLELKKNILIWWSYKSLKIDMLQKNQTLKPFFPMKMITDFNKILSICYINGLDYKFIKKNSIFYNQRFSHNIKIRLFWSAFLQNQRIHIILKYIFLKLQSIIYKLAKKNINFFRTIVLK
jgi:hypothetical protein